MINIGCENRYFATRLTAEIQVAGERKNGGNIEGLRMTNFNLFTLSI